MILESTRIEIVVINHRRANDKQTIAFSEYYSFLCLQENSFYVKMERNN